MLKGNQFHLIFNMKQTNNGFLLLDMERMKTGAILANMGHSNTEIDVARYYKFNRVFLYLIFH